VLSIFSTDVSSVFFLSSVLIGTVWWETNEAKGWIEAEINEIETRTTRPKRFAVVQKQLAASLRI
jgi:hypothetical protein